MANRSKFMMTEAQRRARTFSESFKCQKVQQIELGQIRIAELCKQYEICNMTAHRWINKYGTMKDKPERIVVETQSDAKELLNLKKKIAELERIVGQKQMLLDFKDKMIEIAEEEYGVDIKKKFGTKPSDTTG
jgi:transposase